MEFLINHKLYLIILLSFCSYPSQSSSSSQFTSSSDNHLQPKPTPLGCTITPSDAFILTCPETTECNTFAVLRTNQYYSSLFNLSHYLNIDRHLISITNGFSSETEFLIPNTPLLIPITCKCSSSSSPFHADVVRTAVAGETLYTISSSLEGLTTCASIAEKNPSLSPIHPVGDRARVSVPLRCACPSKSEIQSGIKLLLSYPVREKDSVSTLALEFNSSKEAIISVNKNKSAAAADGYKFSPQKLVTGSTILIPLLEKPSLGSLAKPQQPWMRFPPTATSGSTNENHTNTTNHFHPSNRKRRMSKGNRIRVTVIAVVVVISTIALSVVVGVLAFSRRKRRKDEHEANMSKKNRGRKRNNHSSKKNVMKPRIIKEDVELQKLNLSIRTTSEKKVSFEGSTISTVDGQMTSDTTTPHKAPLEIYALTDLVRATDNFNDHNHVDGTVYHGRLKGKDVAIKRTTSDVVAKVDYGLLQDSVHSHHPNIIRLLGSCLVEDDNNDNSFLVFEYARNGSLKDWLHGGLAVKSQFIASCYCFLNWKQRLKICLDVGLALRYMHEVVSPPYVHRNVRSRNVFLDEEFNGKIGNFGMARCGRDTATDYEGLFCSSDPESWNRGYLAPELVKHGVTSPATDVFAFGVVLLEVLTGKTPLINTYDSSSTHCDGGEEKELTILLADHMVNDDDKLTCDDQLRARMDSALGENYRWEEAVKLARIARGCVDEDPSMRPTAGEIVEELSRMVVEKDEEEAVAGNGIGRDETEEYCNLMHESSSKPLVMAVVGKDTVSLMSN